MNKLEESVKIIYLPRANTKESNLDHFLGNLTGRYSSKPLIRIKKLRKDNDWLGGEVVSIHAPPEVLHSILSDIFKSHFDFPQYVEMPCIFSCQHCTSKGGYHIIKDILKRYDRTLRMGLYFLEGLRTVC